MSRDIQLICQWCRTITLVGVIAVITACGGKPETATLTINTLPEDGYTTMINGTLAGYTPLTATDLPTGTAYVVMDKDGYKRKTVSVKLTSGESKTIEVEMLRLTGTVTINSIPQGANVYLNGDTPVGETPLRRKELGTGKYMYEIRLEHHDNIQAELYVEADNHYTREHELIAKKAQLQIFSRPSGSDIFVNDEKQALPTPMRMDLKPGNYTVGIFQKGYQYSETRIVLEPDQSQSVDIVLTEGDMPLGMVLIPAGEFIFGVNDGSPDERPEQKIFLDAYYMDKFEVTNAQFKEVFPSYTFEELLPNHPVSGVTWKQAADYASAVGKRLPTEMEWEKAARGAKGKEYPWGSSFASTKTNSGGDDSDTHSKTEVGQFRDGASEYGCMDMSGNVLEWTNDWYNPYEGNEDVTVYYGNVYRVLRGGSYESEPFDIRSAKRHYDKPDSSHADYGFRCVMDIQGAASKTL